MFNRRDSKTLLEKPKSEQISIAVPAIIDHATFETVAKTLQARDPRVTAPRVVTGPILLTGADGLYDASNRPLASARRHAHPVRGGRLPGAS